MKSIIAVALAGFFAAVSAQGLSDLPSCALPPLLAGLAATGCDATNFACACSNPTFITSSKESIDKVCSPADQQTALAVAQALCKQAGVTITVPSSGGSTSSAAASSSSASTSSAASTTSAPTSSASSAAPTTGGSTESFPSISQPSTVITSTLNTSATVVLPSGNVTATSTSPPLQSTNAAGRLSGMSGAVALGLVLVAAFAI